MIEISAADAAHGTIMSVNNTLYCHGILKYGTEEQKQAYVTPVASGQAIGAYALTEPQSGSDAANMRTRAVLSDDGKHYVINGKKSWITSGPVADFIMLFAMTDPAAGAQGVTAFMIDTRQPGFIRGKTEPKLGIRASATCEIEFQDYVVDAADVLGEEGQGFKIAMGVLDAGRIGIASQAIGVARAAYEATLDYVKERKAFGKPIGAFQMTLEPGQGKSERGVVYQALSSRGTAASGALVSDKVMMRIPLVAERPSRSVALAELVERERCLPLADRGDGSARVVTIHAGESTVLGSSSFGSSANS